MSRIKRSASTGLPTVNFSDHGPVRYLHLGTDWVQGAMRIRSPRKLELEYIQRMMAWLLWRPSDSLSQGHAVQLGLGAAAAWAEPAPPALSTGSWRLSDETWQLPHGETMGMTGGNVLLQVHPNLKLGVGSYGAVRGRRGGVSRASPWHGS